jgi:diadenosine tetraphosphate (Ap4A) HIT family hydrolase
MTESDHGRASDKICPFCTLPESRIVKSNDNALIIRDGYPISEGHTLIIPKRHVGSFFQITERERSSLLKLLDYAKSVLDAEFKPDGYNIGINDGAVAGQTVSHLHIHLIPRYVGDMSDPRGGVRWIIPDKADYWTSS